MKRSDEEISDETKGGCGLPDHVGSVGKEGTACCSTCEELASAEVERATQWWGKYKEVFFPDVLSADELAYNIIAGSAAYHAHASADAVKLAGLVDGSTPRDLAEALVFTREQLRRANELLDASAGEAEWIEAMREEFLAYDLADEWIGNDGWVNGLFKIIAALAPQAAPSSSASAELQYICDWLGIDGVDMANPNRAETIAKLIKKLIQASSSASENEIRRQLDVLKRNLQSTAERYTAERRVK